MAEELGPPPTIDYTSRDFLSIRADLVDLIPNYIPTWTSRSPNDFGMTLLELFSYVGDGLHYYADRVANEAFLDTAVQRSSVIRLARASGYTPNTATAAEATLLFSNSNATAVVVPAGTKVLTSLDNTQESPVTFETVEDVSVPGLGSTNVLAREGTTIAAEQIGVSNGAIDQRFQLFVPNVIAGSVRITVDDGGQGQWSQVPRLITAGPFDLAFAIEVDENDVSTVLFGDNANGSIPALGAAITATYRVGGGTRGNVAANRINKIIGSIPAGITATNPLAASGGADRESTGSIRRNAPKAASTLLRAVTPDDFANLAVAVQGIGKASATSASSTHVIVAVAPQGGGGFVVGDPTTVTAQFQQTMDNVAAALDLVKPANATVVVQPPVYVPIDITITLRVRPLFSQERTADAAAIALTELFDFDNVVFADDINPGDIHITLDSVDGVAFAEIDLLARGGGTGTSTVSLARNEIPVLGTLIINPIGGII